MPVIDMIFFILIVLMIIHGYMRGFIAEVFSWASLVLALGAAVFLYNPGADFIRKSAFQDISYLPEVLAFAAIFIVILAIIKMLEHVLKDVIAGAKLGGVDKLLGSLFGLLEGLALTALILFVLAIQPFFDPLAIVRDSLFAQIMLPLIQIPLSRGREILETALLIVPLSRFPV